MKTKMNLLKASLMGLAILFAAGKITAQKVTTDVKSGKEILKGEQNGGKNEIKNGGTPEQGTGKGDIKGDPKGGKNDIKGTATGGKNDIKNGTGGTETGGTETGGTETGGTNGGNTGGSGDVATDRIDAGNTGGAFMRDRSNEGKPYDQARLDASKTKCQAAIDGANAIIATEEQHIQAAKDKIKAAEEAVVLMKADKKADQALIGTKEGLIAQANAALSMLESQVAAGKAAIERAKALLVPAVAAK